ncbi:MAG: integrase core domain-containing protein, partial [Bacteroidales bacterium]|nr:integrase core domain-containing protein [Bacteroidales bacterium]
CCYGIKEQNCSTPYAEILKKHKMLISMTEENHCYENSLAERVKGIHKNEYLFDSCFISKQEEKQAYSQTIEMYNSCRSYWALNLKTLQRCMR